MLKVENLTVELDDKVVLRDISFEMQKGRKLFILGANGSGKTTLIRAILNLLPYKGDVQVDGLNVQTLNRRELAQKMSLMPQLLNPPAGYTVYETVIQGCYPHEKRQLFGSDVASHQQTLSILEKMSLIALKDKYLHALSGGQLQRVFLARTLVGNPAYVFLDEPVNHLDIKYRLQLMTLIEDLNQKGIGIVAVVHDLHLALKYADDILLLKEGQVLAYESIEQLDLSLLNDAFDCRVVDYLNL